MNAPPGNWGYVFLNSDSRIPERDRMYVVYNAVDMFLEKVTERALQTDSLEGTIITKGKYQMLGAFGGQRFDAEIMTDKGKVHLNFLVTEYSAGWN
jgi:hypothetical protein